MTYTYLATPSAITTATNTASFTGIVSHGNVTLTFPQGLGAVTSLTGEVKTGALTLDFPARDGTIQELTFHRGTIGQYNQDVANLQQTASDNVTPTQAASVPDLQTPSAASGTTAAETIISFWDAINHRDWQQVWNLGGSNLGNSYADMVSGYSDTAHVTGFIYEDDGQQVAIAELARERDGRTQLYRGSYQIADGVIQSGTLDLLDTDRGSGFAAIAGDWGGHGREMSIAQGGLAIASYRTYNWCQDATAQPCDAQDGNDILDGGLLAIRLIGMSADTATGRIIWASDPHAGGPVTITLHPDQDALRPSFLHGSYFCGPASPQGLCGA